MRVYTTNGLVLFASTPGGLVAIDPVTRVTSPAVNWIMQGQGGSLFNTKSRLTASQVQHGSQAYRIADQAINRPVSCEARIGA